MKKPKVYFDGDADALYIVENKKVIGIEILNASRFLSPFIKKLHLKRA